MGLTKIQILKMVHKLSDDVDHLSGEIDILLEYLEDEIDEERYGQERGD